MNNNTEVKIGALHLRLMDHAKLYSELLANLMYYNEDNANYTNDVLTALEDGLENFHRYQQLENVLSPRSISIEKRTFKANQKLRANDTEGAYHVVFHFDDDSEAAVHFQRKQDQLLYMLILMSSLKMGYSSEFLRKPTKDDYTDDEGYLQSTAYDEACLRYNQVKAVVTDLINLVYPVGENNTSLIKNMDPDIYFTEIVQKMRSAVNMVLNNNKKKEEERWFMPYTLSVDKKRVYQIHMEPTKIVIPAEFQSILDGLPQASDYVDMSKYVSNELQKEHNDALLKGAQEGNVECMNLLAQAYMEGAGRPADLDKAFSLWKKTADLGDPEGLYYVGVCYGTGDVVSQDYAMSTHYFQQAADKGYADALYQLGVYKMHGFGCRRSWKEALPLFMAAADKGCADAANEVGYIYDRGGHGVKKDAEESFKWFLKAAEMDHPEAIRYVIRAYLDKLDEEACNKELLHWVEKGLEIGDPLFYLQMGLKMYENEEYETAFACLEAASENGITSANDLLAIMLIKGLGVEKDTDRAFEYIRLGSLDGNERCLKYLKVLAPDLWQMTVKDLEKIIDMREVLTEFVDEMTPEGNQNYFLQLIDSYRECFHEDYLKEMNKQLSIHRPSTDGGGSQRKIIVRKSSNKKVRYEVLLTLANGEKRLLKLSANSLVLFLLTIICSYKSGYNTAMIVDPDCQAVMAKLVKLALPRMSDAAADDYTLKYMTDPRQGTDNYKIYSNLAKKSIDKAVGQNDDAFYFLFDNNKTIGRFRLRTMNLDVNEIEIPAELRELARLMPDAKNLFYSVDNE